MNLEAFSELYHSGLPRLGPGSRDDTERALSLVPDLPAAASVLDVGCGNGGQTICLASLLPQARFTAVDQLLVLLAEVDRRAALAGCSDRVHAVQGDMADLAFEPESFDLIWSEGAVYNIGFAAGLKAWRRLLKPRCCLALTEMTWFRPDPPEELRSYWQVECPGVEAEHELLGYVPAQGYELLGHFRLPIESWWINYYDHLQREIVLFRRRHGNQPDWLAVADAAEMEMSMHRRYSDYFGYTFFVCRRAD